MAVRTRDDIARVLAPKMGMTHQESERYLKELIAYMTEALKSGDEIVFRGFGRFTPQRRESRTAYDPRTREKIQVKAKIVVKFKPYGELADFGTQATQSKDLPKEEDWDVLLEARNVLFHKPHPKLDEAAE